MIQIPEVWITITESYIEPDDRECAMIEINAEEGDPRSIIISYGPMSEGSDAIMEAGDTYEQVVGEIGLDGFEVPTEDDLACNFICTEIGSVTQQGKEG